MGVPMHGGRCALGAFSPNAPCVAGTLRICPHIDSDGYSDLGNDIPNDAESGFSERPKCREKPEGAFCYMDCELAD